MNPARHVDAQALEAVEIDTVLGDDAFLQTHPAVRHVAPGKDGGLVVWLDATAPGSLLSEGTPDRPPEVELHGPGAPAASLAAHPRAEHVQLFFDGLGDPVAAPRGWWHARVWLKAA
ncbi:hypothetical protein [Caulobacter sp. LjRoot300]|uniref:hypothetical protein n=1 Tax=Caulobacter sp. LjRoot300 TaxID=3342321 RepID=UPI003ECCD17A